MSAWLDFFTNNQDLIFVLILAIFLGVELIKNIPAVLHTPLMSGANALSGVVVVGAILVMLNADPNNYLILVLGFVAVVLGIINVVGGFAVTGRMLNMFKKNGK